MSPPGGTQLPRDCFGFSFGALGVAALGRGNLVWAGLGVLTQALGDANELICWIAAECLGRLGPAAQDAAPALRQALGRDFRLSVIKTAAKLALERIESPTGASAWRVP